LNRGSLAGHSSLAKRFLDKYGIYFDRARQALQNKTKLKSVKRFRKKLKIFEK
jgi:hypothetical protein